MHVRNTLNVYLVHVIVTESCTSGPVEQIPSAEEIRAIGDDKPKFGQSIDVRGEVEGPNMDGNSQLHFQCA